MITLIFFLNQQEKKDKTEASSIRIHLQHLPTTTIIKLHLQYLPTAFDEAPPSAAWRSH
jgi:hypothetical protein